MFSTGFSVHSMSCFSLYQSPSFSFFVVSNVLLSCIDWFLSINPLLLMVSFCTWIPDSDSQSSALLDLFLSSDPSISSAVAIPQF